MVRAEGPLTALPTVYFAFLIGQPAPARRTTRGVGEWEAPVLLPVVGALLRQKNSVRSLVNVNTTARVEPVRAEQRRQHAKGL